MKNIYFNSNLDNKRLNTISEEDFILVNKKLGGKVDDVIIFSNGRSLSYKDIVDSKNKPKTVL